MNEDRKNPSILIVDEDKFLLGIYCNRLREDGWAVDFALSADEAQQVLKSRTFEVVVLDVQVGKMPGMELLERLKDNNLLRESKVIILTNSDEGESVEKAQKLGAHGYIVKAHNTPAEIVHEINQIYN